MATSDSKQIQLSLWLFRTIATILYITTIIIIIIVSSMLVVPLWNILLHFFCCAVVCFFVFLNKFWSICISKLIVRRFCPSCVSQPFSLSSFYICWYSYSYLCKVVLVFHFNDSLFQLSSFYFLRVYSFLLNDELEQTNKRVRIRRHGRRVRGWMGRFVSCGRPPPPPLPHRSPFSALPFLHIIKTF